MTIPDLPFSHVGSAPDELPSVSILIPCYQRRRFIPLIISNIVNLDYPKNKLELVILQDGPEDLFISKERYDAFKDAIGIKFQYKYEKDIRRTIGEKRNKLVKMATHKICAMMDSDDIYMSSYIKYSVSALKQYKAGATSSACMLFVYPKENFKMSAIKCGYKHQMHEACAVFTKKYHKQIGGFSKTSQGEGLNFFQNVDNQMINLDISKLMVCVCHDGNTIPKGQFSEVNEDYAEFCDDSLKNLLLSIVNDT